MTIRSDIEELKRLNSYSESSLMMLLIAQVERMEEALQQIADFTTGYDDVAGVVHRKAREALAAMDKDVTITINAAGQGNGGEDTVTTASQEAPAPERCPAPAAPVDSRSRLRRIAAQKGEPAKDGWRRVPVALLNEAEIWLRSALVCKHFQWDYDQYEAASGTCDALAELLAAAPQPEKEEGHE